MLSNEQRGHDHESDPAHTPGDGWVDEGGASHIGPATHTESGRPHAERPSDEREERGEKAEVDS